MLRLKKKESVNWRGNGFGIDSATWIIVGQEKIEVSEFGSGWNATDTETGQRLVRGASTREECCLLLECKINASSE